MDPTLSAAPSEEAEALPRRFNRDEFYQMLELGFFDEQRVELIDGEVQVVAAQMNFHAMGIELLRRALDAAFGPNVWVRVQMSLDLSPNSVPDPDLAVIAGGVKANAGPKNPTTALLVVEVSDTTLRRDRRTKGSLYAAAGIAEYWILNLVDRQLEVHRDPQVDPNRRFGFGYASVTTLGPADSVSPLAAPQASVAVADVLP